MDAKKLNQIKKWTAALRSGEYKKGRGSYQTPDGYCCLGVGCDILTPKEKQVRIGGLLAGVVSDAQPFQPEIIMEANTKCGEDLGRQLWQMNDNDDLTFDEIADVLELIYIHKAI